MGSFENPANAAGPMGSARLLELSLFNGVTR
jgi:hypothetical protein